MWIETMFRDWQSGGADLGKTGITDRERFHRLIILVCLVYLWFVSVGHWVVKRDCRTFDQPMPIFWFVYL